MLPVQLGVLLAGGNQMFALFQACVSAEVKISFLSRAIYGLDFA